MENPRSTAPIWRFAGRELREASLELFTGGRLQAIERKPLEVLLVLLRNAGDVVTKDELLSAVWAGRVLSDSVLARAVTQLRRAIGDDDQEVVRTVHGYGYRLSVPVERSAARTAAPTQPGLQVGHTLAHRPHFKLIERLGAGGSSEVWLASHDKTGEKRVFKFALNGAELEALKREVTIGRLLRQEAGKDVGIVPIEDWNFESEPFFVEMAYLPSGNLSDWLASRSTETTLPERVDLIVQIAETLAVAHAVGVLHKDIKPGNILIREDAFGRPLALLSDFGSGRLLHPDRLEQLNITGLGISASQQDASDSGTPMYMAPEVISGQMPSQQSDLYSLGVVLYQVVVGDFRRPFGGGWETDIGDELLREDIAAASNVSTGRRLASARELATRLRSLEARRDARDAEAVQQKHLAEERLLMDRAKARRSWVLATLVTLSLGLAASFILYLQADSARKRMATETATAQALNSFLIDDVLASPEMSVGGRADVPLTEILQNASRTIGGRLKSEPGAQMAVRAALGRAYATLNDPMRAWAQLQPALKWARLNYGETDPRTLEIAEYSAYALRLEGRLKEAEAILGSVQAQRERRLNPADPSILRVRLYRADITFDRGDRKAGRAQLQSVLDAARRVAKPDEQMIFRAQLLSADMDQMLGDLPTAEKTLRQLIPNLSRRYGAGHQRTLTARLFLGTVLRDQGELKAAAQVLDSAREDMSRAYGPNYLMTGPLLSELALVHVKQGNPDKAAALFAPDVPQTLYMRSGRLDDGAELQEALLAQADLSSGRANVTSITIRCRLGDLYRRMGRLDAAKKLLEQAAADARSALPPDHPIQGRLLAASGILDSLEQRPLDARRKLTIAIPKLMLAYGEGDPQVAEARDVLSRL